MKKQMPGERGVHIVMLAVCLVLAAESANIYAQDPTPYSMGAMPLLLSVVCAGCSLWTLLAGLRSEKTVHSSFRERVQAIRAHVVPNDILVIFGLFIAYCISLSYLKFVVATPVFLWACMCFLAKGNYRKNLLYAVLTSVFIVVIFRYVFKVILP